MKTVTLIAVCFLLPLVFIFSQENTADNGSNGAIAKPSPSDSLEEERKNILQYGIDGEVLDVLKKLIEEKDDTLQENILFILRNSLNADVQEACLTFFTELKVPSAEDAAISILGTYDDYPSKVVISAIRYVAVLKFEKALEFLKPIIEDENTILAPPAIKAMGFSTAAVEKEFLISKLTDEDYNSQFKPEIILALGEMKAETAVDTLMAIASDETEEVTWRRYACDALGNIGDKKAFPVLMEVYRDPDAMTRLYALSAIGRFDTEETRAVLMQALKDSFWRIRIAAAESLGEMKAVEALDILVYKAEKDPEQKVRDAAIQALGKMGLPASLSPLRAMVGDATKSPSIRYEASRVLTERDIDGSLKDIMVLLDEEWAKKDSKLLDAICKNLSGAKSPLLHDVFVRFLDNPSLTIQIYGVLGIERNGFSDLKSVLEEKKTKANKTVARYITDALESLE